MHLPCCVTKKPYMNDDDDDDGRDYISKSEETTSYLHALSLMVLCSYSKSNETISHGRADKMRARSCIISLGLPYPALKAEVF